MGKTQKQFGEESCFGALVIAESPHATDMAQLVTFIGDTVNKYNIIEEMDFWCH